MFANFPTDDPRMGHILVDATSSASLADVPKPATTKNRTAIIGFPFDQGVARNGGRPGAASGPDVALTYIRKVGTIVNSEYDVDLRSTVQLVNGGLVGNNDAMTLEDGHTMLRSRVRDAIQHGFVPFVIGGGNDQSYPNARGLLDTLSPTTHLTVINIDAHFDVRPLKEGKVHSGSPFRQLLEDRDFQSRKGHFIEYAAQGSQCSAEHVAYLRSRDGKLHADVPTQTEIVWLKDVMRHERGQGVEAGTSPFAQHFRALIDCAAKEHPDRAIFVSFDLDAVRSADAPGVSCASPLGITADQAVDICFIAGANPAVKLVDLSEFSPRIEEYRTGRLVAMMFYYFCLGLAQRP
ncbi:hypothetical protein GGF32_001486 [Allomyces javanicus]|nr:hypothetical protein GGF32_001486 [Allomyces javanicus]